MTLASLAAAATAVAGEGGQSPKGWIGTTAQWTQGLGIAPALLKEVKR